MFAFIQNTMYVLCVDICTVYMHVCACVCAFVSVKPFKRFLRGRGGREDNGSRHYLLLSCRLSIRPHTLWPSHTRTPSRCTCTHAPTRCMHVPDTHTDTHMLCVGTTCVRAEHDMHMLTLSAQKKSHTYASSHPHGCTLNTHTLPLLQKEVSD